MSWRRPPPTSEGAWRHYKRATNLPSRLGGPIGRLAGRLWNSAVCVSWPAGEFKVAPTDQLGQLALPRPLELARLGAAMSFKFVNLNRRRPSERTTSESGKLV